MASGSDFTGRLKEMSAAEPVLCVTDFGFIAILRGSEPAFLGVIVSGHLFSFSTQVWTLSSALET